MSSDTEFFDVDFQQWGECAPIDDLVSMVNAVGSSSNPNLGFYAANDVGSSSSQAGPSNQGQPLTETETVEIVIDPNKACPAPGAASSPSGPPISHSTDTA